MAFLYITCVYSINRINNINDMTHAVRSKESDFALSITRQAVQRLREAALIALGGISLFVLIALWSHHPADPGWRSEERRVGKECA